MTNIYFDSEIFCFHCQHHLNSYPINNCIDWNGCWIPHRKPNTFLFIYFSDTGTPTASLRAAICSTALAGRNEGTAISRRCTINPWTHGVANKHRTFTNTLMFSQTLTRLASFKKIYMKCTNTRSKTCPRRKSKIHVLFSKVTFNFLMILLIQICYTTIIDTILRNQININWTVVLFCFFLVSRFKQDPLYFSEMCNTL